MIHEHYNFKCLRVCLCARAFNEVCRKLFLDVWNLMNVCMGICDVVPFKTIKTSRSEIIIQFNSRSSKMPTDFKKTENSKCLKATFKWMKQSY